MISLVPASGGADRPELLTMEYALACDYVNHRLTKSKREWRWKPTIVDYENPDPMRKAMRSLGEQLEERFYLVFGDMCEKLDVSQPSPYEVFHAVVDELFSTGIRWGRIIALYSFAGQFALLCCRRGMSRLPCYIVGWTASYVERHCGQWIDQHGGWPELIQLNNNLLEFKTKEKTFADSTVDNLRYFGRAICGIMWTLTIGQWLSEFEI